MSRNAKCVREIREKPYKDENVRGKPRKDENVRGKRSFAGKKILAS